MKLAAKTDIGKKRKENQDNYRAQLLPEGAAWALVCDGMGGARGGKLAAELACQTVQGYFAREYPELQTGQEERFLRKAFEMSNLAICTRAAQDATNEGMGTTAVCALLRGGVMHVVHVGDSRLYLLRDGRLRQMTTDHSVVQEMVESGQLTQEEASHHPDKNLITRALGVEQKVDAEYQSFAAYAGDIFLLCTDGLSNMVPAEACAQVLRTIPPEDAPAALIEQALEAGGQDNITAMVLALEQTEDEKNG